MCVFVARLNATAWHAFAVSAIVPFYLLRTGNCRQPSWRATQRRTWVTFIFFRFNCITYFVRFTLHIFAAAVASRATITFTCSMQVSVRHILLLPRIIFTNSLFAFHKPLYHSPPPRDRTQLHVRAELRSQFVSFHCVPRSHTRCPTHGVHVVRTAIKFRKFVSDAGTTSVIESILRNGDDNDNSHVHIWQINIIDDRQPSRNSFAFNLKIYHTKPERRWAILIFGDCGVQQRDPEISEWKPETVMAPTVILIEWIKSTESRRNLFEMNAKNMRILQSNPSRMAFISDSSIVDSSLVSIAIISIGVFLSFRRLQHHRRVGSK